MADIGIVGLGHMGGAMAHRLLDAGHRVYGTARSRDGKEALLADGLQWRSTPRDVAAAAQIVITSVPDDAALSDVGAGIVPALTPEKTWVDMSTVSPDATRAMAGRVRERGSQMLDAPVSGSVPQVIAGTLTIMVGGDEDAYRRVEPVLRVLGTPTRIGPNGHGIVLKLAVNISLAAQMLAFAEGLALADRWGLDRGRTLEVMTHSPIGSPMLQARAQLVFDPPDEAWFDIDLMEKDIDLALAAARRLSLSLPATKRADEVLDAAKRAGFGRSDIAALFLFLDRQPAGEAA
jgi:3-hydroxyisobutyrate dehydrogenase